MNSLAPNLTQLFWLGFSLLHSGLLVAAAIYAFYRQRDMKGRASRFRQAAKKKVSFDLDYYFNMVDQNPETYLRQ